MINNLFIYIVRMMLVGGSPGIGSNHLNSYLFFLTIWLCPFGKFCSCFIFFKDLSLLFLIYFSYNLLLTFLISVIILKTILKIKYNNLAIVFLVFFNFLQLFYKLSGNPFTSFFREFLLF